MPRTIGVRPNARTRAEPVIALGVALASLALLWACVTEASSDYFANGNPSVSLRWNNRNADAWSEAAWRRFSRADSLKDRAIAARDARRALALAPMDTLALRVLALKADGAGDHVHARRLMEIAGARSWRDTLAQTWLFEDALKRRNYPAASFHADAILRRRDDEAVLFPSMLGALADRHAIAPFAWRLAEQPNWRADFLRAVVSQDVDSGVARGLFEALASTNAPPTDAETTGLMTRLIADGDYRGARAEWAKLLGKAAKAADVWIYDPEFRGLSGAQPFNWRLVTSAGATAEFDRTGDGHSALHVQAPAVRTTLLAEQLLVLPPGPYRLSGDALVTADQPGDRFSWVITCLSGGSPVLAGSVQGTAPKGWHAFTAEFVVPSQGCNAQWLRLSGLAHDGFELTDGWYRGFRLVSVSPASESRADGGPPIR